MELRRPTIEHQVGEEVIEESNNGMESAEETTDVSEEQNHLLAVCFHASSCLAYSSTLELPTHSALFYSKTKETSQPLLLFNSITPQPGVVPSDPTAAQWSLS
jgi:hypothetical protein